MNGPPYESDFPTPEELRELFQVVDFVTDASNELTEPRKIVDPKRLAELQAEREKLERYRAMGYEFTGECVDVVIDGPGDPIDPNRPRDPKELACLKAERDKIIYWTACYRRQREQAKKLGQSESGEPTTT